MGAAMRILLTTAVLLIGAWTAAASLPRRELGPARAQLDANDAARAAEAAPRAADPGRPDATVAATTGRLRLPDGSCVPALNGVTDPVPMTWPADLPYAPITGVQRDPSGRDWYVHADGSQSTTVDLWSANDGRGVAWTLVANPAPALPVEPSGS
jgi:hypothetical protein